MKDELKKEKDEIKKKPEESEGILERLSNFFTGLQEKEISDKSYIPKDRGAKDLIKISREELKDLRDTEKKLTDQLKKDKLSMNQYKIYLNKQLTDKYKGLESQEYDIKHKSKLHQTNMEYLQEQLDLSVKDKIKFLDEKERIVDSKLIREKQELDTVRNAYIDKLNKSFNHEYNRLNRSYDTRLKKQKRVLLDLIKDYGGDNIYIQELIDKLKKHTDIPIMVNPKKTILTQGAMYRGRMRKGDKRKGDKRKGDKRKGVIRTKRKFKHPEEGVFSVIDFLTTQ